MLQKIKSDKNTLPLITIAACVLFCFFPYILGGKILYAADQIGQLHWVTYFNALLSGNIPLWNPYALGGMPTFEALYGDSTYPIFILLGIIFPLKLVVTYNFVLHVFIAGFTSYFLLRKIWNLPYWICVALSIGYMFNTNYISLIFGGHTGKVFVLSWLPLCLFFLIKVLSPQGNWKHALGFSLSLILALTHIQLFYYVLVGFFFYYVFQLILSLKQKYWINLITLSIRFWMPIFLGLGLIFFLLWAPVQYNKNYSVRGTTEKQTYEHATSWSLHPPEVASLLIPEFAGINEKYWGQNPFKGNSEYPGLVFLFLALLGLIFCRTRWMIFWTIVAGVVVIFSLGSNTPLFKIFYNIVPGIKNFRAPSMTIF